MGKNKTNKKPVRRILRKLSKLVSLKNKGGKEKKPYQQIVGGELVTVPQQENEALISHTESTASEQIDQVHAGFDQHLPQETALPWTPPNKLRELMRECFDSRSQCPCLLKDTIYQDTPWVPQFTLGEPKEENTTAELCSKSSHISIDTDTARAPWEEPTRHSATNSSSFPLDDSVTELPWIPQCTLGERKEGLSNTIVSSEMFPEPSLDDANLPWVPQFSNTLGELKEENSNVSSLLLKFDGTDMPWIPQCAAEELKEDHSKIESDVDSCSKLSPSLKDTDIPQCTLGEFELKEEDSCASLETHSNCQCVCLVPKYHPPLFSDGKFDSRVTKNKVSLEYCVFNDELNTLTGYVRVKNLCYHKKVFARITADGWQTSHEEMARYVPSISNDHDDSSTDHFEFNYNLSLCDKAEEDLKELQVAVCFVTDTGQEHWDNNNDENYVHICSQA